MQTASGFFVTGTDTGVGKTVVSAAILSVLRAGGLDAVPMKPVQTGCAGSGDRLTAPDLAFCLAKAGVRPRAGEMADMAPYRFRPACSPHLAAELARVTIRAARIRSAFRRLAWTHEAVVVEGAGGTLVPISPRATMLDVMAALGLPVIVVARPSLGTINHTLLTLNELRRSGRAVAAVVVCASRAEPAGRIERDNLRTIARVGRVRVIGPLPHWPDIGRADAAEFRRRACAALPPAPEWRAMMKGTTGVTT